MHQFEIGMANLRRKIKNLSLRLLVIARTATTCCDVIDFLIHLVATLPKVATFNGIRIYQRYNEHHPPHFHATHGGAEVSLLIADSSVLAGGISPSAHRNVLAWVDGHRAELALNWVYGLAQMPIRRIS